ncbi:MAG: M12 family metallo-peptidase [Gemmatimonadota bacterium]
MDQSPQTPRHISRVGGRRSVNSTTRCLILVDRFRVNQEKLYTITESPSLNPAQSQRLGAIIRRYGGSVQVGAISATINQLLRRGARVRLPLSATLTVTAVGSAENRRASGRVSWNGRTDSGWVHVVLGPRGVYGLVTRGKSRHWIEPLGGGLVALAEVDEKGYPPEHSGIPLTSSDGSFAKQPRVRDTVRLPPYQQIASLSSAFTTTAIGLMVVYTSAAAAATEDIESLIELAVDVTNTSYADSYVLIAASLAYSGAVTYSEAGRSHVDHVNALQAAADGMMDELHAVRNQYLADVVLLIDDDDEACGRASVILATATQAFGVVHHNCAVSNYTLAHEVGHLQGARHDRNNDPTNTPFQYGHGFQDPGDFRTVMAYPCDGASPCPRVALWSTPLYGPGPLLPRGTAAHEDNSRVLNETKNSLAAFREPISVIIAGPTSVKSTEFGCSWTAVTSGGVPAATFAWSGVLVGSGGTVSGTVAQAGYLDVIVQDAFGRWSTSQVFIMVDDNAPSC